MMRNIYNGWPTTTTMYVTGDLQQRICTAAEMRFYFDSLMGGDDTAETNYVRPNVNCNRSSWIDGCEPGWACSAGPDQKIDLQNSKDIPYRPIKCQMCCPGFFCPHGLTCMIRKHLALQLLACLRCIALKNVHAYMYICSLPSRCLLSTVQPEYFHRHL